MFPVILGITDNVASLSIHDSQDTPRFCALLCGLRFRPNARQQKSAL